jgi:parallel beta-helix repeat protein
MARFFHNRFSMVWVSLLLGMFIPSVPGAGEMIMVPSIGTKTIAAAMTKAKPGDTVLVENGKYREHVYIKAGVTLKARNLFRVILDGKGRGTVVSMGSNSSIIGCVIQNGTIGLFSKNPGVTVSNCHIIKNWQTGIITVRHLPQIEDNIIAFNRASGIQGWDVRSTAAAINHNTIAYNANNGIALGGASNVVIENNVIAYNERFALKLRDESDKSKITNNNFYRNLSHAVPAGNHSFDPAFISPKSSFNFKSDPRMCCQIKGTDNENLGVRYNY